MYIIHNKIVNYNLKYSNILNTIIKCNCTIVHCLALSAIKFVKVKTSTVKMHRDITFITYMTEFVIYYLSTIGHIDYHHYGSYLSNTAQIT